METSGSETSITKILRNDGVGVEVLISKCRTKYSLQRMPLGIRCWMDVEKTIADIELLERTSTLSEENRLQMSEWKATDQKHDKDYEHNPSFRLWRREGM